jgi:hypothetical protein
LEQRRQAMLVTADLAHRPALAACVGNLAGPDGRSFEPDRRGPDSASADSIRCKRLHA